MENHHYGSVKNKIVATDLQKERDKIAFDKEELSTYLLGGHELVEHRKLYRDLQIDFPDLANTHKFNDMTINERQTELRRRIRVVHKERPDYFMHRNVALYPYHGWIHNFQGLVPIGMHLSMFTFVVRS